MIGRFFPITLTMTLCLCALAGGAAAQGDKMTPEELIAKHAASVGSPEKLAAAKLRMAIGSSVFEVRLVGKKAAGRAVLASDSKDIAFFSTFDMTDYRMERIGLFQDKVNIPYIAPGRRSSLGNFLMTYDPLLRGRIFGGSIFSSWALIDPAAEHGKLKVEGIKKVDGRDAWVLEYEPKGGLSGKASLKLYFDVQNFHHIRTVYTQKETDRNAFYDTGSAGGNRGQVPGEGWGVDMANNGSTLTEDFQDFREDAGLMLPHKYSIVLRADLARGTSEFRWDFAIEEYRIQKSFPAGFFSFQANS